MKDPDQFYRVTEAFRKALSYAEEEARRFNHNYIGTEHLLLGLVRLDEGSAATVLKNLGVDLYRVRSAVEFIIGRGDRIVLGEVGLTPRSKQVLELASDEANRMSHHFIGPEHLLLGLVREGEGIAAGVLESLGVNLPKVRRATLEALGQPPPAKEEPRRRHEPSTGFTGWSMQTGRLSIQSSGLPGMMPPIPAMPPMLPFGALARRYRPFHIEAAQPERTAVGRSAVLNAAAESSSGGKKDMIVTLLGWVIINSGGEFTLTLYNGLEAGEPLAVISNPPTGACFPFHCAVQHGLAYTLEGTPGSVTIIYDEGL